MLLQHPLNNLFPFPSLLTNLSQIVCGKENNEPVCGILLLFSLHVYYVRYIERNGIFNTVMVLIVGPIYG